MAVGGARSLCISPIVVEDIRRLAVELDMKRPVNFLITATWVAGYE